VTLQKIRTSNKKAPVKDKLENTPLKLIDCILLKIRTRRETLCLYQLSADDNVSVNDGVNAK